MASYGLADNPEELVGGFVERLLREAAIQRLDVEGGDVDQSFPFRPVQPPERDLVAALERDVQAVVLLRVVDSVAHAVLLRPFTVVARGDLRVEDEEVPREA